MKMLHTLNRRGIVMATRIIGKVSLGTEVQGRVKMKDVKVRASTRNLLKDSKTWFIAMTTHIAVTAPHIATATAHVVEARVRAAERAARIAVAAGKVAGKVTTRSWSVMQYHLVWKGKMVGRWG